MRGIADWRHRLPRQNEYRGSLSRVAPLLKFRIQLLQRGAKRTFGQARFPGCHQLASSGLLIRSDVRTTLSIANADSRRCQEFLSQGNADELETCTSKLNSYLDRLDRLK